MTVTSHWLTWASNSAGVLPAHDRANAFSNDSITAGSWVATPSKKAGSLSKIALYGCCAASDGSALISSAHLRNTKSNCGGNGCSTHNVPSLSNAAIRSATATKSGPSVVTRWTKSRTASLALPSFQLASLVPPILESSRADRNQIRPP